MSTAVEIEETVDAMVDTVLPVLDDAADLSDDEPVDELDAADTPSPRLEKLLAEIAEAEMLCANAEEAVNEAKAVLKEAKAEYDGCVLKLRRLAKAVRNDEDRPLFDGIEEEGEESDNGQYDAALKESIDVLGLPAGVVSKLAEEHVSTIGDLEQLREDITLGRKQWPKGIGPAKVDVIETAVIEWLAEHCDDGTAEPDIDDVDGVDDADDD
jgi:hypothetical protein